MKLSRTDKKNIYESVMKTLSKHVYAMLNEKMTAAVIPSVQRWLDDQISLNKPESLEEVRRYLFAKDPGTYGLCTAKGDMIMQSYCNSYISDNVSWYGSHKLFFAVTKTGNLAAIDCHYGSVRLVIEFIRYDFSLTFTENLGKLCKKVTEVLKTVENLDEYKKMCVKITENAKNNGYKQVKFSIS